jgi:hypothetical protein
MTPLKTLEAELKIARSTQEVRDLEQLIATYGSASPEARAAKNRQSVRRCKRRQKVSIARVRGELLRAGMLVQIPGNTDDPSRIARIVSTPTRNDYAGYVLQWLDPRPGDVGTLMSDRASMVPVVAADDAPATVPGGAPTVPPATVPAPTVPLGVADALYHAVWDFLDGGSRQAVLEALRVYEGAV